MQISNIHESMIVMKSIDTRFFRNVFEAVQNTRSTCFIGSKTTRRSRVVLDPIKHSCSFFKHYLILLATYIDRTLGSPLGWPLLSQKLEQIMEFSA